MDPVTIRFESLKRRAAGGGCIAQDDLAGYDVRQVGVLRRRLPSIFPRALRAGPLVAYIDTRGTWQIAADETRH